MGELLVIVATCVVWFLFCCWLSFCACRRFGIHAVVVNEISANFFAAGGAAIVLAVLLAGIAR